MPDTSSPAARPEDLLLAASQRLKAQWPSFSVRAVAAKLGISPSYWSKILRGQKPIPNRLLPDVVRVLRLDTQTVAQLQRSILNAIETDALTPKTGLKTSGLVENSPVDAYRSLGREDFWLLEEWYYIPVLNLVTVTDFNGQEAEIAKRLGLRLPQAEEAVRRLLNYGYLVRDGSTLKRTEERLRFPVDRSFPVVRKYHSSLLMKAREELQKDSAEAFESRLISAVSFAGSSQRMKEARLILEEAMYRAANLMADELTSDEVYQLNLQIFPLTQKERK